MVWDLGHTAHPLWTSWRREKGSISPSSVPMHVDKMESFRGMGNPVIYQIAFILEVVNIWNGRYKKGLLVLR